MGQLGLGEEVAVEIVADRAPPVEAEPGGVQEGEDPQGLCLMCARPLRGVLPTCSTLCERRWGLLSALRGLGGTHPYPEALRAAWDVLWVLCEPWEGEVAFTVLAGVIEAEAGRGRA